MTTPPPETLGFGGQPLAYFDLEFTGLDPHVHDITEIALLFPSWSPQAVEATRVSMPGWAPEVIPGWGAWSAKVTPLNIDAAEPVALEINGYDAEVWEAEAIPLWVVIGHFEWMFESGMTVVGHNLALDLEFLRSAYKACGVQFELKYKIDSATLIWEHLVPLGLTKGNLHDACTVLGISNEGEHRALADVLRCKGVVEALRGASFKIENTVRRIEELEASRDAS